MHSNKNAKSTLDEKRIAAETLVTKQNVAGDGIDMIAVFEVHPSWTFIEMGGGCTPLDLAYRAKAIGTGAEIGMYRG